MSQIFVIQQSLSLSDDDVNGTLGTQKHNCDININISETTASILKIIEPPYSAFNHLEMVFYFRGHAKFETLSILAEDPNLILCSYNSYS